jgi:hypothetical protein
MNKLSKITYERLLCQAQEAKELEMERLSEGLLSALGPMPRAEEKLVYSHEELQDTVYKALWKVAMEVIAYHDLKSVDAQEIDQVITDCATNVIEAVETSMGVKGKIGVSEPKVFGQR